MESAKYGCYEIFNTEMARNEVVKIATSLARYLHDNSIESIVFIDSAARPASLALSKAWSHLYPKEKKPGMYFINPMGLDSERREDDVDQEFRLIHKNLTENIDKPVLIFDVCVHTGTSMNSVIKALRLVGFQKIFTGSAQPAFACNCHNEPSNLQLDFIALQGRALMRGVPFGKDKWVDRDEGKIISRRDFQNNFEHSLQIRGEITSIFAEAMRKENNAPAE